MSRGLVVIGDSISKTVFPGGGPASGFCWPAIVQRDAALPVSDLAVSATLTVTWRDEPLPIVLFDHPFQLDPYAVIQLGTNDALVSVSVYSFTSNLNAIVANAFAAGASDALFLLTPTDTGDPATHALREQYASVQLTLAASSPNLHVIDARDLPHTMVQDDGAGVHLRGDGQEWLAARIATQLAVIGT